MRLLAYGVIPSTIDLRNDVPSGVEGDPLRCVWGEALGLIYSLLDTEPSPKLASVYAEIVERLHQRGVILPFRYGCIATSELELLRILHENQDEYQTLLDDLRDCEELSLGILWNEAAIDVLGGSLPHLDTISDDLPSDKSATRHLLDRKSRYPRKDAQTAQAEYVTKLCERFFTGLVKLARAEWQANPEVALLLRFLVERKKVPTFAERFRQFGDMFAVQSELTGPFPLYTFSITTPIGYQGFPES